MLRPTPGDPWGVEQHHWNTGAEENQQLNPGVSFNFLFVGLILMFYFDEFYFSKMCKTKVRDTFFRLSIEKLWYIIVCDFHIFNTLVLTLTLRLMVVV